MLTPEQEQLLDNIIQQHNDNQDYNLAISHQSEIPLIRESLDSTIKSNLFELNRVSVLTLSTHDSGNLLTTDGLSELDLVYATLHDLLKKKECLAQIIDKVGAISQSQSATPQNKPKRKHSSSEGSAMKKHKSGKIVVANHGARPAANTLDIPGEFHEKILALVEHHIPQPPKNQEIYGLIIDNLKVNMLNRYNTIIKKEELFTGIIRRLTILFETTVIDGDKGKEQLLVLFDQQALISYLGFSFLYSIKSDKDMALTKQSRKYFLLRLELIEMLIAAGWRGKGKLSLLRLSHTIFEKIYNILSNVHYHGTSGDDFIAIFNRLNCAFTGNIKIAMHENIKPRYTSEFNSSFQELGKHDQKQNYADELTKKLDALIKIRDLPPEVLAEYKISGQPLRQESSAKFRKIISGTLSEYYLSDADDKIAIYIHNKFRSILKSMKGTNSTSDTYILNNMLNCLAYILAKTTIVESDKKVQLLNNLTELEIQQSLYWLLSTEGVKFWLCNIISYKKMFLKRADLIFVIAKNRPAVNWIQILSFDDKNIGLIHEVMVEYAARIAYERTETISRIVIICLKLNNTDRIQETLSYISSLLKERQNEKLCEKLCEYLSQQEEELQQREQTFSQPPAAKRARYNVAYSTAISLQRPHGNTISNCRVTSSSSSYKCT